MKLTAANVRTLALPHGKTDHIEFDDNLPGFGVRIRGGGSRTFVFQYKLGNKQRRLALGPVKALDFSKVKDTAKDLYSKARLGIDPAGEKAEAKVRAAETFGAVVELFLTRQKAKLRPTSYSEIQRHLAVDCKSLHPLRLDKIERRTIAALLSEIVPRGGTITNRIRSSLSSCFAWAMREGLANANPVIGTNREIERPRDRVLSDSELALIWNALPEHGGYYAAVAKLLLLTGQRASEIADLRWSEIDFDQGVIVLPGERTKNRRSHQIPLSDPARAILTAQPRRAGRDPVFGHGGSGFNGWHRARQAVEERILSARGKRLPPWTVHDFRRTVATRMADLGVQPHVIEAVLNHISGHKAGVAGIYNRSTYDREKRDALNLWAEHLLAVVEGRKPVLVPLKRA
jgi:integrase